MHRYISDRVRVWCRGIGRGVRISRRVRMNPFLDFKIPFKLIEGQEVVIRG